VAELVDGGFLNPILVGGDRIGRHMSCGPQWSSTFDPFALTGTVHRFPQIAAPLHIQPIIWAVGRHVGLGIIEKDLPCDVARSI